VDPSIGAAAALAVDVAVADALAAGAAVAGAAAGAAGAALAAAGAVATAPGGAAVPAGFALEPAAALPFAAPLVGVCAPATAANEINPAKAVNHKALLRRINTLSRLRIGRKVPVVP
jgi:hypothetical protein